MDKMHKNNILNANSVTLHLSFLEEIFTISEDYKLYLYEF